MLRADANAYLLKKEITYIFISDRSLMHGNFCISVCILSCIEFLIFIFLTQNHFRSSAMTISDPGHCILTASSDGKVRLLDTRHPRMT